MDNKYMTAHLQRTELKAEKRKDLSICQKKSSWNES